MEKKHLVCPNCGLDEYHKYGKNDRGKQKYQCKKCGRYFLDPENYKISDEISCPKCGHEKTVKQGTRILSGGTRKQRYKCKKCRHSFYGPKELPPKAGVLRVNPDKQVPPSAGTDAAEETENL